MPAKESDQSQVAIAPNRTLSLSDVLHFGQIYDATFKYVRHRMSTALPSAPGILSVLAGNLIWQTRMKGKRSA